LHRFTAFGLVPILDRGNTATPASAASQTIGVVLNSDADLSLNHCDSKCSLWVAFRPTYELVAHRPEAAINT
jgi:hypothetical protein